MPINSSVIILGRIIKHIKKAIISQRFKVTSNSLKLYSVSSFVLVYDHIQHHILTLKSYYEHNVVENENNIDTLLIYLHKQFTGICIIFER